MSAFSLKIVEYIKDNILLISDSTECKNVIILSSVICLLSMVCILTIGFFKTLLVVSSLSVFILALIKIHYLLYFSIVAIPFIVRAPYGVLSTIFSWGIVFIFILIWMINKTLTGNKIDFPPKWLIIFTLLFMFWLTISNINAGLTKDSLLPIVRSMFFFLFVFVLYDVIDLKNYKKVLWFIVLPYSLISVDLIISSLKATSLMNFIVFVITRQADFIIDPNRLGGMYLIIIPIMLSIFIYNKKVRFRKGYLLITILLIIGLFISNSRAAYIGLFFSLLYLVLLSEKRFIILSFSSAAVLLILINPYFFSTVELLLRTEGGLSFRELVWKGSISLFQDSPIFGVGTGIYKSVIKSYLPLVYYQGFFLVIHNAHNYFLSKMCEMGLPGLIFMVYIFYRFTKDAVRSSRIENKPEIKAISIGLTAMMIGFIARSMFEAIGIFSYGNLYPDIYFWMLMFYPLKVINGKKSSI